MSKPRRIKLPLKVIPEPEPNTRSVLTRTNLDPFLVVKGEGAGNTDLVCGRCSQILVVGLGTGLVISNIVIKCPKCESFNEIP